MTSPTTPVATESHIARHTSTARPVAARSTCDAVCHCSSWRRETSMRHSVIAMAWADSHASFARTVIATPTWRMLVPASWATVT